MAIAADLDQERMEKGPRGPMHGIPVLLKDNIDTKDQIPTTAGSHALMNNYAEKRCADGRKITESWGHNPGKKQI